MIIDIYFIYLYLVFSFYFLYLSHYLQTALDDAPITMVPFQGRLLVGVGKLLRIYDIGKKKMLRKCENKVSVDK